MYVAQTDACSVPNSAMPPTKGQIARGIGILGRTNRIANNAQQAFACLLNRTDLNTNGWPLATHGGVPASTITGCPSPNVPDTQMAVPGPTEPTGPTSGVNLTGLQYWPRKIWTLPEHHGQAPNSPNTYPMPPAPPMQPLTTQAHSQAAAQLTAMAAAATVQKPAAPPTFPTTGNVCLDLMLNYVDPSQVSPTQLTACSMNGYQGIKNGPLLTNAMIAWRNANYGSLPKVPDQPNVPEYTQAMGQPYGMGDWDGASFISGLVAAIGVAAAGLYLWQYAKRMGYV
jgi:hypothetical protein